MEALGLNLADWFILIVLIASGIISFARGFTKEFLSLFLWLAAFIAAISLEYLATPKINEFIGNEEISKIISYIVVFLIFIFIGGMTIKFISKLIKWSGASGFDRFLGIYVFNEYMNLYAYLGAVLIVLSGVISLPSQIKQLKDSN